MHKYKYTMMLILINYLPASVMKVWSSFILFSHADLKENSKLGRFTNFTNKQLLHVF